MLTRLARHATWPFLLVPRARVVRVLSTEIPAWRTGEGDPEKLAAATFSKDPADGISVFLVTCAEDEVRAAAAHALCRGNSVKEPAVVLRITLQQLRAHAITVRRTSGETGVCDVDQWHRDLHGPIEHYVALTKALLAARIAGADNVRDVQGRLLARQYEQFGQLSAENLKDKARQQALRRLQQWQAAQHKKS